MKYPFPFRKALSGEQGDGIFVSCPPFCSSKKRSRCSDFYAKVFGRLGFHQCPYGYSIYCFKDISGADCAIFGLRIADYFDNKKLRSNDTGEFSPKFSEEHFLSIMSEFEGMHLRTFNLEKHNSELQSVREKLESFINSTVHEFRKLNAQIKSQSEELMFALKSCENTQTSLKCAQLNDLNFKTNSVFQTSNLISIKLNLYDFWINPDLISGQMMKNMEIFKKFEKVKHCLAPDAKKNRVTVNLNTQKYCDASLDAHEIFELLPYVLVENAIKFSPPDQSIDIDFVLNNPKFEVRITNFGPLLKEEEMEDIFKEDVRGYHSKIRHPGTGKGLHFAKKVCDQYNIQISVSSTPALGAIEGVPQGKFTVSLIFNECYYNKR